MRKVLIISPYFPPVNSPDMHRIRQSLPFYKEFGWEPTVVCVDPKKTEIECDDLLLKTFPASTKVYRISAYSARISRKFGFSNVAFRSFFHYWRFVGSVLRKEKFDLIFFSTTQFPITILGPLWKILYRVPYIIDMQDPWASDYYLSKPKAERPPKFWLSYYFDKILESIAMSKVDGIIAVSDNYHIELRKKYQNISEERCFTITFGAPTDDFNLLSYDVDIPCLYSKDDEYINIVYVGAVGSIMKKTLRYLFHAISSGISQRIHNFDKIRLFFIGTSYAARGEGRPTVVPVARAYKVDNVVYEKTDRVPYFQALQLMKEADIVLMLGSDNPSYTASKIYPCILSNQPFLPVFHEQSSVVKVLSDVGISSVVTYSNSSAVECISKQIIYTLSQLIDNMPNKPFVDWVSFEKYTARQKCLEQARAFDVIYKYYNKDV